MASQPRSRRLKSEVGNGIVVAGGEMADVQAYPKLRGEAHQFLQALDRSGFVRIVHLGMRMERGRILYLSTNGTSRGPLGTRV